MVVSVSNDHLLTVFVAMDVSLHLPIPSAPPPTSLLGVSLCLSIDSETYLICFCCRQILTGPVAGVSGYKISRCQKVRIVSLEVLLCAA
jgi:hypothetical protein